MSRYTCSFIAQGVFYDLYNELLPRRNKLSNSRLMLWLLFHVWVKQVINIDKSIFRQANIDECCLHTRQNIFYDAFINISDQAPLLCLLDKKISQHPFFHNGRLCMQLIHMNKQLLHFLPPPLLVYYFNAKARQLHDEHQSL